MRNSECGGVKTESMEQKAFEGGLGNSEMKRKRHRAWNRAHRDRGKSQKPEGECGSWLNKLS